MSLVSSLASSELISLSTSHLTYLLSEVEDVSEASLGKSVEHLLHYCCALSSMNILFRTTLPRIRDKRSVNRLELHRYLHLTRCSPDPVSFDTGGVSIDTVVLCRL